MTLINGTKQITATLVDETTTKLEGTGVGSQALYLPRELAAKTLDARMRMGWKREVARAA